MISQSIRCDILCGWGCVMSCAICVVYRADLERDVVRTTRDTRDIPYCVHDISPW